MEKEGAQLTQLKNLNPRQSEALSSDDERFAILRLIRSPGIGPARFFQLYHHYGSALEAVAHFKEATRALQKVSLIDARFIEQEWKRHEKIGAKILTFLDLDYPPLLREIKDCPPVLSILGSLSVLQKPLLGVVGSRNASLNGRHFITRLVHDLTSRGFAIISGFARGMDTAAHEASLDAGTVGVLAGGVDIIYPEENVALYKAVQEKGCLLSEMPLGLHPQGRHFPRRNRLISGMAQGVLVSEARHQSGSMVTAHYALEQGRDVFAVPGSPLDLRCAGSNSLLKQGAILVTRVEDILESLNIALPTLPRTALRHHNTPLTKGDEKAFLDLLSVEPLAQDLIIEHLGIEAESFNALCSKLELEGKVTRSFGGVLSLCLKED